MTSYRIWPSGYGAARKLMADLVCSVAFLLQVAAAAWIVISSVAHQPTWL
jgi:hypothetical protein